MSNINCLVGSPKVKALREAFPNMPDKIVDAYINKWKSDNDHLGDEIFPSKEELEKLISKYSISTKKSSFSYNQAQQQAIDGVSSIILNNLKGTQDKQKIITIQGAAGTGKTTIINEIIKKVNEGIGNRVPLNIEIAALSHKAKSVLAKKISKEARNRNRILEHSVAGLLGMRERMKQNKKGEWVSVFERDPNLTSKVPIKDAQIIFVDEASMINEEQLQLIEENANPGATIIFIGDNAQLPPIRQSDYYDNSTIDVESDSPVFNLEAPKYTLTERVRQGEGNPILDVADKYRSFTEGKSKTFPSNKGVKSNSNIKIGSRISISSLVDAFKEAQRRMDPNYVKIVAYRNNTIDNYNRRIHEQMVPKGADLSMSYPGEPVMFYDNFSQNNQPIASNSSEGIVVANSAVYTDFYGLQVYEQTIQLSTGETVTVPLLYGSDENLKEYERKLNEKKQAAIKNRNLWRQYYEMKESYANVKLAYAITSHKSQGSTYTISIVDANDINSVVPVSPKQKSQSIYTAITRASEEVVMIDSSSENGEITDSIVIQDDVEVPTEVSVEQQSSQENAPANVIQRHQGNWSREEVKQHPENLYIFTDNTDRDSGNGEISADSKYAKKYGEGKHFPTMTQAVIRGLDNAMPISTQRYYHEGAKGVNGRWADADAEEFERTIKEEVDAIIEEFSTGKYKNIIVGNEDGFFNTKIANISKERTPKLYEILRRELIRLNSTVNNISSKQDSGSSTTSQRQPSASQERATSANSQKTKELFIPYNFRVEKVNDLGSLEDFYHTFPISKRLSRVSLVSRMFSQQVDKYVNTNGGTRLEAIKAMTPGGVFNNVLKTLTILSKSPSLSETQRQNFSQMVQYFVPLAEEASFQLVTSEGIKVDVGNGNTVKEAEREYFEEGDTNTIQEMVDSYLDGETIKDGWMTNYREVGAYSSLSQEVRKAISSITKVDKNGQVEKDEDLGLPIYLDAEYVHAVLIDKLKDMVDDTDMIPILENLEKTKPWIRPLIDTLNENPSLMSQFYQDFRKDFQEYWIQQEYVDSKGNISIKTFPANKPEGIGYLLEEWRGNIEGGNVLSSNSLYTNTGRVASAEKLKAAVKTQSDKINALRRALSGRRTVEAKNALLKDPEVVNNIVDLLHSIGAEVTAEEVITLFTEQEVDPNSIQGLGNSISGLLDTISPIFSKIEEEYTKFTNNPDNKNSTFSIVDTFTSAYTNLAKSLDNLKEGATESSARENGKSHYSHVNPNYLGKLIKNLKNVSGKKERFTTFIEREFGQYEWFRKEGVWLNDWLKILTDTTSQQGAEARENLAHKVVLNYNKTEYADWDSLDYTKILINEYFSVLDKQGHGLKYAWYHVPILSDATSAEFIKFVRYSENFEEETTKRLADVVLQEYDRIQLVRARLNAYKKGNSAVQPIANFDKRGLEFCFFPELNNLQIGGKPFIDALEAVQQSTERKPGDLQTFVQEAVKLVMQQDFDNTVAKWEQMGLLDTNEKGEMVNLQWKSREGAMLRLKEYFYNSKLATSQIIELTTTDLAYYKNMEDFQKRFKEVHAPSLRLNTHSKHGRTTEKTIYLSDDFIVSSVVSDIHDVIMAKHKAGELNDYNAASILAKFGYSNKEINGKQYVEVGSVIVESEKVNVADAQAYRSLSSYRAIMDMSGQWTPEMDAAYERLQHGEFNIADLNLIWQTKKPYVYTQVSNTSGVEGKGNIKTPVQHKNSEFLLLAMHDLIAGPLKKSGKLVAINEFMEENGIDVVQFESTTKVGGQGTIDLSNVNSKEEVKKTLLQATGISTKNKDGNPNVVHKVPYEDYGIQTQTPEHIIDHTQLVGTQIRKLITADMSDDAIIEVNGKSLTKKEWLKLYNEVNTENILQSFLELRDSINTKEKLSKALLEQIRGDKNYGPEYVRALTLDEDGNFNIPLYDPIVSNKIQTLINSLFKSRITKQKIKGGACIQASCYGLSGDLQIKFSEDANGEKRIEYMEVYMPAYSKKFYEPLMKKGSLELDIDAKDGQGNYIIDRELLKAVGYRVPTEDKYSMVPIKIKGFLPQANGSAIMLPAEITTLSGSDFDKHQC